MDNKKGLATAQIIALTILAAVTTAAILHATGTIKIPFIPGAEQLCPNTDGTVVCGICNKDIVLSDNPHAGQCRLCPAGTTCSGDLCGEIKCSLNESSKKKVRYQLTEKKPTPTKGTDSYTLPTETLGTPNGQVGERYDVMIEFTWSDDPSITFTYSLFDPNQPLPPGITLSPNGELKGMPTKDGTYEFAVCSRDAQGNGGCKKIIVIIEPKEEKEPELEPEPPVAGGPEGRYTGKYTNQGESVGAWTCKGESSANIEICVTKTDPNHHNLTGVITFPAGFNDKTTYVEEGGMCPPAAHCSGGPGDRCSAFDGIYDPSTGKIQLELLTIDGGAYTFNKYYPELNYGKKTATASIVGTTMVFHFSQEEYSGGEGGHGVRTGGKNSGTFTATRVGDC